MKDPNPYCELGPGELPRPFKEGPIPIGCLFWIPVIGIPAALIWYLAD